MQVTTIHLLSHLSLHTRVLSDDTCGCLQCLAHQLTAQSLLRVGQAILQRTNTSHNNEISALHTAQHACVCAVLFHSLPLCTHSHIHSQTHTQPRTLKAGSSSDRCNSAAPPPGTIPSSTAAKVAFFASSMRSLRSSNSASVAAPTCAVNGCD